MPAERTIGNYVLGPLLGRGGMSEVHSATHRFLDDKVAIKLLRAPVASNDEARTAFLAEATRTRAIDHPGVVRVIDFGCDGDDFYLVMERLDGETLAARLARAGRLAEAEVRRLGAALADGAAAAHARGIVHRDLKPGNIMLVGDRPKIVDFGIARQLDRAAATTTGSRTGTPAYMAPEQLTGGLIAPCVDIWALGAILYEAVTGRLPFDGYADGRCPQLFETTRPIGEFAPVSPALAALIGSCLDRDPARRPQSMAAIARALRGEAGEDRITEDLAPAAGAHHTGAHRWDAASRGARAEGEPHAQRDLEANDTAAPRRDAAADNTATTQRAAAADAAGGVATPSHDAAAGAASNTATTQRDPRRDARNAAVPHRLSRRRIAIASLAAFAIVALVAIAWRWRGDPARSAAAEPGTAERSNAPAGAGDDVARGPRSASGLEAAAARAPGHSASDTEPSQVADGMASPSDLSNDDNGATATAMPQDPQPGPASAASAAFTVLVRSAPAGASVIIDGKRVGVTPASIALRGPAQVLVTRAGYQPSRVRAERPGPILVRLVPLPKSRGRRPNAAATAGETLD